MLMIDIVRRLNDGGIYPYVENNKLKTKSSNQALTKELVQLIKDNKEALIEYLSKQTAQDTNKEQSSISAISRDAADYPLSFAQQRLWVLHQLEGDGHEYNVNFVMKLTGELNIDALQQAFDQLMQRHEILRTRYVSVDGEPRQVVDIGVSLLIRQFDLSGVEEDIQWHQARQLIQDDAVKPFDLALDRVIRCLLITLSPQQYLLSFTKHHIASDGWSMGIINQELSVLYSGIVQGEDPKSLLPEPTLQYIDYAVWQKQTLGEKALTKQLEYWQRQLNGMPMLHALPMRTERQSLPSVAGAIIETRIPGTLLKRLYALANAQGVTLFILLQSAFALLLSRWTYTNDIVIGSPVAGRRHVDVEALVGFFVNTLVLRTQINPADSFIDFLQQNSNTIIDAFANQDVPFDTLVEALNVPGKHLHSPLFQIMFALQNNEATDLTLPNLTISGLDRDEDTSKFELNLISVETDEGLVCFWNYATSVFDALLIEHMAASFEVLLSSISEQPGLPVGILPILSEVDKRFIHALPPLPEVLAERLMVSPDSEYQVINDAGVPVPVGAVGELLLTQSDSANGVHTGLLVCFTSEGQLKLIGVKYQRCFSQGYWHQLDVITQVLEGNEYIREAEVCAYGSTQHKDEKYTGQLVVYINPAQEITDKALFLSGFSFWLASHLPEHHRPKGVVLLPFGASDAEISDFRAHAAIDWFEETTYRAPVSEVEKTIAEIWQQLLRVESVGLDDNFFALGGTSMTAVRLEFALRKAFDIEISITDIFTHAELAKQAQLVSVSRNQSDQVIPVISEMDRSKPISLSFSQQRLWFIDRMQNGSCQYNMQFPLFVKGKLEQSALEESLVHMLQRHEVLRTVYHHEGEEVWQQIISSPELPFLRHDFRNQSEAERRQSVEVLVADDAAKPFDLTCDTMLRVNVARLQDDRYFLLFTFHHIAFDGWSSGIFFQELSLLYNAKLTDVAGTQQLQNVLPPVPVQYADFTLWQRQQLSGEHRDNLLNYWRGQLEDMPTVHSLPLDYPRPSVQAFSGDNCQRYLNASLSTGLRALAEDNEVTLFILLETAFALFVARWGNTKEVVIGSPVAGRKHPDLAGTLGFFVNNLVLATRIDAEESFTALLKRSKGNILDAFKYDDLPFELLVEVLQPERSINYNPLYQISFALQSIEGGATELSGLSIDAPEGESEEFASGNAKMDLSLYAYEDDDRILLHWNYDTALFAPQSIASMSDSFLELLNAILQQPNERVLSLSMVDEQRREWLNRYQGAPVNFDAMPLLHQMFERRAAEIPDKLALEMFDGSQQLTYQELNRRANRLAHHLIAQGITPDSIVVICLPRSVELIVAVLATLKAGGAFVCLDSSHPVERLHFMLEDSKCNKLLTQEMLVSTLNLPREKAIFVDQVFSSESDHNPDVMGMSAANLAYGIYTSGTTGTPKASLIPHGGISSSIQYLSRTLNYTYDTSSVQFVSTAFDAFVFEFGNTLSQGGKLIIINDEIYRDPLRLEQLLREKQVSHMFLPPAILSLMTPTELPDLTTICTGGEAIALGVAQEWAKHCRFFNAYGPSEASIITSMTQIDPEQERVHIGTPIDGGEYYVLNEDLALQPPGTVGELYVGGNGLARGYLDRPEMTAQRFIQHSFYGNPPVRLYRTGDLVSRSYQGTVEFVGRIDDQVKLRGFRIELSEIEHKLNAIEGISTAIVLLREHNGEKALAAYVISELTEDAVAQLCHQVLSQQLPGYMLPSGYAVMLSFPRTPNGKTDKQALLKLPLRSAEAGYVPPGNELEERLVVIWSELLNKPAAEIGVVSDFFMLGGHSLLAARLSARINQQLAVNSSVRDVFEFSTIKALAGRLNHMQTGEESRIRLIERPEQLPLSYAQQRLWLVHCLEGASPHYNMPFAFRISGALDIECVIDAMNAIVQRHEVLRMAYSQVGERAYQCLLSVSQLSVQVEDAGQLSEMQIQRRIAAEAMKPFDLETELPIRLNLLRLAEDETLMLLTLHHIASDGWSIGVMTREFMKLYQAGLSGQKAMLPPLTLQYPDFAVWQRSVAGQRSLALQRQYWMKQLEGIPVSHRLPLDKPRPAVQSFEADMIVSPLSQGLSRQLKAFADAESVSVFMLLHSVFSLLLSRWSGESDIVIGTPTAGRNHAELEPLIGCFINNLVLRSETDQRLSFREHLKGNKEMILDAFNHQDYSFEELVEHLNTPRTLSHAPVFQILLNMQNNEQVDFTLPGLKIEPVRQVGQQIKYDLNLTINEHEENLVLAWSFATSLFASSTIDAMAERFKVLLGEVIRRPEQPMSTLGWLTDDDYLRWGELNQTLKALPRDVPIPLQILAQCKKTPDAIAVDDGMSRLSYEQLLSVAAAFQQQIRNAPGQRVGIYCQRQSSLLSAILAVWGVGASYIPIDPNNAAQRIAAIIEDAGIEQVLTDASLVSGLPADVEPIFVDRVDVQSGKSATDYQIQPLSLDDTAYIIYTSGSTGAPKGVVVSHRGLSDYCAFGLSAYYRPSEINGSLVAVSHAFDLCIPGLLLPLMVGDKVTLMPQEETLSALADSLVQQRSERTGQLLRITPSHIRALLALFPHAFCSASAHAFVIGGENFTADDARQLRRAFPESLIINHYGPTEAVIGCTYWPMTETTMTQLHGSHALPIGRPMANTRVYVVDRYHNLQPPGVLGELCIAGVCVAKGYLNQPEMTADKFIDNPFSEDAEYGRLYRTGDLVYLDKQGLLTIVGRSDQQLKLRGYRIEKGDIEAQIMTSGWVKGVVVDQSNDQLLAWFVPNDESKGQENLAQQLADYLHSTLPGYMVPEHFVCVEQIPLTVNGKIDRKALTLSEWGVTTEDTVPPANDNEQLLLLIWEEVLQRSIPGVTSNFFAVGGNSLKAVQLTALIRRRFERDMKVSAVMQYPTIRAMASQLGDVSIASSSTGSLQLLQQGDDDYQLVLLHAVGGDLFAYSELLQGVPDRWQVYGLQHRDWGSDTVEFIDIPSLAKGYCQALAELNWDKPVLLLGWSMGGLLAIEMARQLIAAGREPAYVGAIDSGLSLAGSAPWEEIFTDAKANRSALTIKLRFDALDDADKILFASAYGLAQLSQLAGQPVDQVEQLVLCNIAASRDYLSEQATTLKLPNLHYLSASQHPQAIRQSNEQVAREIAQICVIEEALPGDHFSIMKDPSLAHRIVEQVKHLCEDCTYYG